MDSFDIEKRRAAVKVLAEHVVRSIEHDTTYSSTRGIDWACEVMAKEVAKVSEEIQNSASRLSLKAVLDSLDRASLAEGEVK